MSDFKRTQVGRLIGRVTTMAPILWAIIRHFRAKLSEACHARQESFSRVTATPSYNMGAARSSELFLPLLEFNGQLFLAILLFVGGYQALSHDVQLQ